MKETIHPLILLICSGGVHKESFLKSSTKSTLSKTFDKSIAQYKYRAEPFLTSNVHITLMASFGTKLDLEEYTTF